MNGWEKACVIIGIVMMAGAEHWYETVIGFVCLIAPICFNYWIKI